MNILIVEANEAFRRTLRSLVADLFAEVYERSTSAEALAAYALLQPDWVLLGLNLRELDSLETTQQLTAVWPEARIALVTDNDDQDSREAAQRAGASACVMKENLIEVRRILAGVPRKRNESTTNNLEFGIMKKLICLFALTWLTLPALAQDTPKAELFTGYSYLKFRPEDTSINASGFNVALSGNVNKHFALVGEFARHTGSKRLNVRDFFGLPTLPNLSFDIDGSLATFLFGPRVYARSDKVAGFAHALVGGARFNAEASGAGFSVDESDTTFAFAFGGGLDVNAGKHVAFRLAQVDYVRTKVFDSGQNSFRFSTGLVFRFGQK